MGSWTLMETSPLSCRPRLTLLEMSPSVCCQEKCDVLCGSVCDYDDYFYDGQYDESPNYFDYDDPGDCHSYPDVYGFIEPDDCELYHDLHGTDDCGVYCVARRDAGGTP